LLLHGSRAGADGVPVASQAVDALIEPVGFALQQAGRFQCQALRGQPDVTWARRVRAGYGG
jgi:hypothetical protein